MKKLHLEIEISAPLEKVWNTTLGDATYREWTLPFSEGGYFKGDWSKGSKMLFLGIDPETGKEGGMISEVADNVDQAFISLKHYGFIRDGVEDTESAEVKSWTPSFENYTFEKKDDGTTQFLLDMDTADEHYDMFLELWPKALLKLKEISERV